MIQQIHLTDYPTPEESVGKKITMPGQSVDIRQAIQMYSKGTLEERAKGFYEEKGLVIPDFDRMSKIERLEALTDYRKKVFELQGTIQSQAAAGRAAQEQAILQKTVKQKVDEQISREKQSS